MTTAIRYSSDEAAAIVQTIAEQLTHAPQGSRQGLGRLRAMIGATLFSHSATAAGMVFGFGFKLCRRFNCCHITLCPDDTYTVRLMKLNRLGCVSSEWEQGNVYFDQLSAVFTEKTGLDTHL